MKNKTYIWIIAIIVVGAAAFFGGMKYSEMQRASRFASFAGGRGTFFTRTGAAGGQGFQPVRGQIISSDSGTLTVKLSDGSSKIVVLSNNTSFVKSTSGSKGDIKSGDTVMVMGTTNSDGSVTANEVQINPPQIRINGGGQGPTQGQ